MSHRTAKSPGADQQTRPAGRPARSRQVSEQAQLECTSPVLGEVPPRERTAGPRRYMLPARLHGRCSTERVQGNGSPGNGRRLSFAHPALSAAALTDVPCGALTRHDSRSQPACCNYSRQLLDVNISPMDIRDASCRWWLVTGWLGVPERLRGGQVQ